MKKMNSWLRPRWLPQRIAAQDGADLDQAQGAASPMILKWFFLEEIRGAETSASKLKVTTGACLYERCSARVCYMSGLARSPRVQ